MQSLCKKEKRQSLFCVNGASMPVRHLLDQSRLKNIFQECFPKLHLETTINSDFCEICQKCLEHFKELILLGDSDKEEIDLEHAQRFKSTESERKRLHIEDDYPPKFFSQKEKHLSEGLCTEDIVIAVKNESMDEFDKLNLDMKTEDEAYFDLTKIVTQLKNEEIEIKYDLSDEERDEALTHTSSWTALQIDEKENDVKETNILEKQVFRDSNEGVLENSWRNCVKTQGTYPDFCYYCKKEVTHFARHVQRNHCSEKEVISIISEPARSKERKELLRLLRNKGNYLRGISGHCKPVRAPSLPTKYLPCTHCLGYYCHKRLWLHKKICAKKLDKRGELYKVENDSGLAKKIFPRMRPDGISLEAKRDSLICAFGARTLKIHRKYKYIHMISRRMRELARVLLEIKKMELSVQNLFQALKPRYFSLIVEATKNIAQYDIQTRTCRSPTAVMNINTSLRQCCNIALNDVKKSKEYLAGIDPSEAEANLKNMLELLISNWKCQFPHTSNSNFQNQYNVSILSMASDVKLLTNHLKTTAANAVRKLSTNDKDTDAYNALLETIFCSLMASNQMTPRELQEVPYALFDPEIEQNCKKLSHQVSTAQGILMKTSLYIINEQEGGQQVPILFNSDLQEHIKILLQARPNFLSAVNPFLFQKPSVTNTSRWVHGVLNDFVKNCGAKNPDALTSAHLTKYLAVLMQVFGTPECDVKKLIGHMGLARHTSKYLNFDDIYEIAKISKILLLIDQDFNAEFKGKSLDQICIDLEETLLNSEEINEDRENTDHCNGKVTIKPEPLTRITGISYINDSAKAKTKRSRRTLVPWTFEQKNVVVKFFKYHVKHKKPPKRQECDVLIARYPNLLHNKSWLKIKVFVQNLYTKKTSFNVLDNGAY